MCWVVLFLGFRSTLFSATRERLLEPCPRADPTYIRTANETGGVPMFLLRSEAAKAFHLMRESTRNNVTTVFWGTGLLDRQPQTVEFPIDSLSPRVTFAISFDTEGGNASILPPSGPAISQNSGSSEITELNCGRIVTVASPLPGNWRVALTGKGRFWVEVQAQSDLHLVSAEFVREAGRPGHEGLFRIDGQPVAGRPATLRASLSAAGARTVEFHLASERGEMIQQLSIRPTNSTRDEFAGTLDLPPAPFRVAVSGLDSNGRPFQRFYSHLFRAESVEVLWNHAFDELPAGSSRKSEFTVRNIGIAGTFKLTVTDARQFITSVVPREITLGHGQSAVITVDLSVPAGTQPGTGDDVVVVAASTTDSATSNSSIAHFSVAAPDAQSYRRRRN